MTQPKLHVLLIEDNPDHAILIRGILQQIKNIVAVSMVQDGQLALEFLNKAQTSNKLPDLIFLDLKLPRLNGFELLKICKQDVELCDIPIVVLSSSDIKKDIQQAIELGANEYLVKPMNLDQLYDQLNAIISHLRSEVSA